MKLEKYIQTMAWVQVKKGVGVKTNTKICAEFYFRKKDKEVYVSRNEITLRWPQIVLGSLTVLKAKD